MAEEGSAKRQRIFRKCESCRLRKIRCTPESRDWSAGEKCDSCLKVGLPCGPNSVAKRYEKLDTSLAPPTDSLAPTPQPARQPAVSSRISDASTANTDGPYPSSGAAFTADHDSRPRDALDPIYMRTPKPRSVPMIRVDNPERNWSGALTVPGQHHRGSATPSPSSPQPSFRHSEQPRLDDGPPHVDVAKMREDLMQQETVIDAYSTLLEQCLRYEKVKAVARSAGFYYKSRSESLQGNEELLPSSRSVYSTIENLVREYLEAVKLLPTVDQDIWHRCLLEYLRPLWRTAKKPDHPALAKLYADTLWSLIKSCHKLGDYLGRDRFCLELGEGPGHSSLQEGRHDFHGFLQQAFLRRNRDLNALLAGIHIPESAGVTSTQDPKFRPATLMMLSTLPTATILAMPRLFGDESPSSINPSTIDADIVGRGMLHLAIEAGRYDLYERVYHKIEDRTTPDRLGFTPLTLAVAQNNRNAIQYLLQKRRHHTKPSDNRNLEIRDALGIAVRLFHDEALDLLLKLSPISDDEMHEEVSEILAQALWTAVKRDRLRMINVLLRANADPMWKFEGRTAIEVAELAGHEHIAALLRQKMTARPHHSRPPSASRAQVSPRSLGHTGNATSTATGPSAQAQRPPSQFELQRGTWSEQTSPAPYPGPGSSSAQQSYGAEDWYSH